MISDLKTTHLLRASPKAVFCGQLTGAIVSIFMAAGVYIVFSTAYPCINDLTYTTCSFPTPDVQSWRVSFYSWNCTFSHMLTHSSGSWGCGLIIDPSHPTIVRVYSNRIGHRGCDFGCCEAYCCPAEISYLGSVSFSVSYFKTKPYKLDIQEL